MKLIDERLLPIPNTTEEGGIIYNFGKWVFE